MTNITALSQMFNFLINKKLKPMKKWSLRFRNADLYGRKSLYLKKIKYETRGILNLISGNDLTEMLKGFLLRLIQ